MAAGFAYFKSFLKTADDFAELGKTKLPMPVASIGGEKANGQALAAQVSVISPSPWNHAAQAVQAPLGAAHRSGRLRVA
jgi:hypothetical protein